MTPYELGMLVARQYFEKRAVSDVTPLALQDFLSRKRGKPGRVTPYTDATGNLKQVEIDTTDGSDETAVYDVRNGVPTFRHFHVL
jgi:hypothetical protein